MTRRFFQFAIAFIAIAVGSWLLIGHWNETTLAPADAPALMAATSSPRGVLHAPGATGSFAQLFSADSPLRTKLTNLRYQTVQSPLSSSIWNREVFNARTAVTTGIPMYVSSDPKDLLVTIGRCTSYGGGCKMAGKRVHLNQNDLVQGCEAEGAPPGHYCDGHILLIDEREGIEVDCWGARTAGGQQKNTPPFTLDLTNNQLVCAWGGWYPLKTTGLNGKYRNENDPANGSAMGFGPAAGLYMITPNELLAGHIDHALALNAVCMDAPGVYPSDYATTDGTCDGGTSYPHYGDGIVYVGQTDAQIAASSRSVPCKAILTALHDYGAYFSDTGDNVTRFDVVSEVPYISDPGEMGADLWPQVYSALAAGGDGDASGNWNGCFNGLRNTDFNLIELVHP